MISPPFFPRRGAARRGGEIVAREFRTNFHASRELEGMESSQLTAAV